MYRTVLVLLCVGPLIGCQANQRFLTDLAAYLEARQLKACVRFDTIAGGGFGPAINVSADGFIATGGIDPALCMPQQGNQP